MTSASGWHRLPCAVRQYVFEYDPTYRTIFTHQCLPLICMVTWQYFTRRLANTYKEREERAKSVVATSPYAVELEYKLFSCRREIYLFAALLRFTDVYFAPRKDQVPPDHMTINMATYDPALAILVNEERAGRFFLKWEIPPHNEFMAGYVIGQTELQQQFYVYGTQERPDLATSPLQTFANGMCYDPRRFQWYGQVQFWYDVLYVHNGALVLMEHDIDFEPFPE